MPLTNNLKAQVDLPVWEWCRFAPASNTALTALTTARDGSNRYLFYFYGSQLYKYDTIGDVWSTLSVGASPTTALAIKYAKNQGYRGSVLSATSSTLQIPSTGVNLNGYKIRIISGTGAGQERTISSTNKEVIHDSGFATTANANTLADSLKKWKFNQWEGYAVKIVQSTGFSQYREILYNDVNSLAVNSADYDGRNFLMAPFSSSAPYGTPAASTSGFNIVSQTVNLDSPWTTTPDTTSKFMIMSGGIWWITNYLMYYYDILSDRWVQKILPGGFIQGVGTLSTDFSLCPTNDIVGVLLTGNPTAVTSKSLTDNTLTMTKGSWINYAIKITSGLGSGQERRIINNTTDTFILERDWDIIPDVSSTYIITSENSVYLVGGARSQLFKYYPESSVWATSHATNFGVPSNMALKKSDNWQSHAISTANRVTNGITGVNATPTAAGVNYVVGDLLTVSTGGTLGRVAVESVSATGQVLTVSLYTAGSSYTTGTGKATTGGAGTGCTIEITSVGTIGVITTPIFHDFAIGDSVTFVGATESAWNTTYNILGIQGLTVVEIAITATANAIAKYSQATTLLVDSTKNWIPGEHTGKLLGFQGNSLTGVTTFRRILGNSETTISFISGTAPTNGNSRYFIQELEAFGADEEYLADNQLSYGYPTSASISSVTDTSKNWITGAFINNKILLTDTSGNVVENIVTNNTNTTLSLGRVVAVGSGTNTIAYNDFSGVGAYVGVGTSIFSTQGNGVVWTGTRYAAVGSGTNTIAWSNDGITWNGLGATIHTSSGNGVAFNGIRTVTVGSGTNTIAWAYDTTLVAGFAGLGATIFSTQGNAIAWNGSLWVAVGQGTNTIAWSNDQGTFGFTGLGTTIFSTAGRGVCWAGTKWIAVGNGTNSIATSTNGTTWTGLGSAIFSTQGNAVAWNGTTAVAVGSGTNTIAYSTDNGATWTGVGTAIFSTSGNSIAWNGSYWVAGGQGTNTTAYSLDGITWTGNGSTIITTAVNGLAGTTPGQSVVPNIGITPDTNTRYKILTTTGHVTAGSTTTLTDPTKKWKSGQFIGKRVLITSGAAQTYEYGITANTATGLTWSASISPDLGSTYTIIGKPPVSTGIGLEWNFGTTDSANKGRYLISSRGGTSHTFDIYNITTNRWDYGKFILGHGLGLTTGTMYAYNEDRLYFIANALPWVYYYDFIKNEIVPFATIPYGMSTAVLSNRMEIVKTEDGLKYLYIMRHSSTEMWRTLIYY